MRRWFDLVKEAIGSMRYAGGFQTGLYWFIRVGLIALPILVVLIIAGLVYANMNDIEIKIG